MSSYLHLLLAESIQFATKVNFFLIYKFDCFFECEFDVKAQPTIETDVLFIRSIEKNEK